MLKRDPKFLLNLFQIPFLDRGESSEFIIVQCPYHNDTDDLTNAHGAIHRQSGNYTCFICKAEKTNVVGFIGTKMNQPVDIIAAHADNIFGTSAANKLDPALVELCHNELLCSQDLMARMYSKHGISVESIQKYKLGYYAHSKRVTIPVYDMHGALVNLRQYKYNVEGDEAKMISPKGAQTSVYLIEAIRDEDEVILTEGEFKAILLRQHGFNAVASTGGAGTFKQSWAALFKDKKVVILYDVDKPGIAGAEKVAFLLARFAKSVKNILMTELSDIPKGDVTDWFVTKQLTATDLRTKIDGWAEMSAVFKARGVIEEYNEPFALALSDCADSKFSGKLIETTAMVSAKDSSPYVVPGKVVITCSRAEKFCQFCPIYTEPTGDFETVIPKDSKTMLELINSSQDNQSTVVKKHIGIPHSCSRSKVLVKESYNIEEVRLVPEIKIGSKSIQQVTRRAFYLGNGIACNKAYAFSARACAQPDDAHATMILYEAEQVANDITTYSHTVDLSIFRPLEWTVESIESKLKSIYDDFSSNVTKIYQRPDLHLFYDLVWHTALHINFEGREIKGWGDAMVIGDSGQGKSETSSRLSEHYKCGERVDCKRASVAGILGGLQESNKRWFMTWGAIPLNDGRLVILEEVKGMGPLELTTMTDMRSSGVAEVTKIIRERAMARTRLIWITNPRTDQKLSAYNYGVEAVKEVIGALEDIRRFDMVMGVSSGDVALEIINGSREASTPHTYTSELCSSLIGFAWSRKASDIVFEPDALDEVLQCAMRMGRAYSSACPIVEPSDQRLKIARLSTALAIRTYSVNFENKVIVRKCHVQVLEAFLNRIYSSPSLGYKDYSLVQANELVLRNPQAVIDRLSNIPHASTCVQMLLDSETLNAADVANSTEYEFERAQELLGFMARENCIKRGRKGGYRKTAAFIELLKQLDRSGKLQDETYRTKINQGEM